MKQSLLPFLLLLFAINGIGCNSGPTEENPGTLTPTTIGTLIVGRWDWIQSDGGFRGSILTPLSEGYHQTFTFSSNLSYKFVRTPDSVGVGTSGSYSISRQFYPMRGDTEEVITLASNTPEPWTEPTRLVFQGTDTIQIGDNAADGLVSTYTRIK